MTYPLCYGAPPPKGILILVWSRRVKPKSTFSPLAHYFGCQTILLLQYDCQSKKRLFYWDNANQTFHSKKYLNNCVSPDTVEHFINTINKLYLLKRSSLVLVPQSKFSPTKSFVGARLESGLLAQHLTSANNWSDTRPLRTRPVKTGHTAHTRCW